VRREEKKEEGFKMVFLGGSLGGFESESERVSSSLTGG